MFQRGQLGLGNKEDRLDPVHVGGLLGRAMLGQLVVVAINYECVRTVKSNDSALCVCVCLCVCVFMCACALVCV